MATRVYILIETAVGETSAVSDALKEMPMMKAADTVTGPFDIIAVAEADDLSTIGDLISDGMRGIPGIVKTITCLSVRR
ncbi:MAG: Lrp/AsnC ligand binding domain-containing protein [Dehalococcoidia bacterium]|nr:Lrp/AsnC ligand binding domain-containing protein [Dehalococcoidia bacterium]